MTELNRDDFEELMERVEDMVELSCSDAFKNGRPMSGQMAWTAIYAFSCAKLLEFEGAFDDDVTVE